MSVLDRLRSQNSIEHVPEPEPALAASAPGSAMPDAGPALPAKTTANASLAKADPPGIQAH